MNRVAHPLYLGELALYVGYSLQQTQAMVDELVASGSLRPTTAEEKLQRAMRLDAEAYSLVGAPDPSKARY
jgi:hypothetical protein